MSARVIGAVAPFTTSAFTRTHGQNNAIGSLHRSNEAIEVPIMDNTQNLDGMPIILVVEFTTCLHEDTRGIGIYPIGHHAGSRAEGRAAPVAPVFPAEVLLAQFAVSMIHSDRIKLFKRDEDPPILEHVFGQWRDDGSLGKDHL